MQWTYNPSLDVFLPHIYGLCDGTHLHEKWLREKKWYAFRIYVVFSFSVFSSFYLMKRHRRRCRRCCHCCRSNVFQTWNNVYCSSAACVPMPIDIDIVCWIVYSERGKINTPQTNRNKMHGNASQSFSSPAIRFVGICHAARQRKCFVGVGMLSSMLVQPRFLL